MSEIKSIYLDNGATTKISDAALQKYIEVSENNYGNPSSLHTLGFSAEKELDEARSVIMTSLGAKDARVIFTASGSEANNLAIIGRALSKERYKNGAKIITTAGEHASVTAPIKRLRDMGFHTVEISTLGGEIDFEMLEREMTGNVILVSVMMVNNETGALYDTKRIGEIMRRKAPDALLHVDATQSYMKVRFTKQSSGADMITLSSHKIHGPKGVGALVIDGQVVKSRGLSPLILGGGQEDGFRSGTENVPAVAAFGAAVRESMAGLDRNIEKISFLRTYLIESLKKKLPEISITLPKSHAPHILNITLPSIKSETMLHYLSSLGIYVSSGSACSSNTTHTSSALTAYGRSPKEADCSIRISFSRLNNTCEVDALTEGLASGLSRLAKIRR